MASKAASKATAAKKDEPAPAKKEEPKKEEIASPPPEQHEEKAKAHRATSNVFNMFQQSQIQEFKEAFGILDGDRDGVVSVDDLKALYGTLGRDPSESELKEMLKECPGQLNFTAFLTLFGEKMHGTDPESTLRSAFAMFDREGKGFIPEDYLKDLLTNVGDQFKENELKAMWKEAPVNNGLFDYNAYVTLIKRGNQND